LFRQFLLEHPTDLRIFVLVFDLIPAALEAFVAGVIVRSPKRVEIFRRPRGWRDI